MKKSAVVLSILAFVFTVLGIVLIGLTPMISATNWLPTTGFVDTTCAPTSVYSAYNSIPAGVRKHIDTTPNKGHNAPIPSGYKRIEEIVMK